MTVILAIDPGPDVSGWCLYCDGEVLDSGVSSNPELLTRMLRNPCSVQLAIERVASYGMAVGREVFETCEWVGRFLQAWHDPEAVRLVYRKDMKMHLCGTTKAKDSNVRQAILDLFPRVGGGKTPQIGTKALPGPLHGVSSHAWSALALAITCAHQIKQKEAA